MGGKKGRLSAMAKASRFSHHYFNSRKKKPDGLKWLEIKKEVEAICGTSSGNEEEIMLKLIERSAAARRNGLDDIPMPSDMTLIRKKRI